MTTIHLLDSIFSHDIGSVAGKPPSHFQWQRIKPEPQRVDGILVVTDTWVSTAVADSIQANLKIAWLREPECLWPGTYKMAMAAADHYDMVLTYYRPLLDARPDKFRFAPYGGIWLPRATWGIKPKTRNISMLIGSKMSTDGHRLRHEIYQALDEAGLLDEVDFYGVYGTPVDYGWQTKYKVLADYRYTIVTETCRQDNLFTEILLDPMMLGTTPIFWGCPNYRQFFGDDSSIMPFKDVKGLIDIMNRIDLGEDDYQDYLPQTYGDMLLASEYEITEDWLWHNVLKEMI